MDFEIDDIERERERGAAQRAKGYDPAPRKPKLWIRTLAWFWDLTRVIFAAGLFFILLVGASYFALGYFIRGTEIDAPDLTAARVEEALASLKELDLLLVLEREEPSNALAKGEIISQRPRPGARVKTRTPVRVVVSSGPRLILVPEDLIDLGRLETGIELRRRLLKVGNVAFLETVGKGNDRILATDPPGGTGVPPGTPINLLVSSESGGEPLLMPDLYGLTPTEANEELARYGLEITETRQVYEVEVSSGAIHGQTPAPGTPVVPGTEVEVIFSPGG